MHIEKCYLVYLPVEYNILHHFFNDSRRHVSVFTINSPAKNKRSLHLQAIMET